MSSNCSFRPLNPAVAEFERLLATVSKFACCALIPLAAVYKARIISNLQSFVLQPDTRQDTRPLIPHPSKRYPRLNPRKFLRRRLIKLVIEHTQSLLHHLRLP